MDVFATVINNIRTTLASPHVVGDGVLTVSDTSRISLATGGWGRVTLIRLADAALCIYKFTGISGNDLTGLTPIEGTTDIAGSVNDIVEMRVTAGHLQDIHGNLLYTTTSPVTTAVGGISAGTTFTNIPVTTILDQLLHPYQTPAFTGFSISGATTQEVGQTFSGSKTFNWSTSNSTNIEANSVQIAQEASVLASGLANTGSTSLAVSASLSSPGSVSWTVSATNTQSASLSASTSIAWKYQMYYGTSASTTLTASAIQGLTSNLLTSTFSRTYSMASNDYKYICFPTVFGSPSAFKDASTQLSVAMADSSDDPTYSNVANGFSYALVSVTNSFSVTTNYRVYRTKNVLGGSINITVS